MKSRRANLAECSLSTSHSTMAGTPKGETRNARTRNTMPPTVCPPMNRMMASSVSTMQPSSHTADATQNKNVTIAASRDSATITGAARILRTIIAATSIKNRVGLSSYPYYTAGKKGSQGCQSAHRNNLFRERFDCSSRIRNITDCVDNNISIVNEKSSCCPWNSCIQKQ